MFRYELLSQFDATTAANSVIFFDKQPDDGQRETRDQQDDKDHPTGR
jgi:hypothetical protein